MKNLLLALIPLSVLASPEPTPADRFRHPPSEAHAGVWWHWMGANVTREGIEKDLEYFRQMGITSATIFGLSDSCTPWAYDIPNPPGGPLTAYTPKWWEFVRLAAEKGRVLGIDIGVHNCPGYTTAGGPWVSPQEAMRELCFSKTAFASTGGLARVPLPLPRPSLAPRAPYPVHNPETGRIEKPACPSRTNDLQFVTLLAFPARNPTPQSVQAIPHAYDLQTQHATVALPPGDWNLLLVLHIPTGSFTQPNQWRAFGLECDKMSQSAVLHHLDHLLRSMKAVLGNLVGDGLNHILIDSYEAGPQNWTPLMPEEFRRLRGYDLLPWLPALAGFDLGTKEEMATFLRDFDRTIRDLFRDRFYRTVAEKLHQEGLQLACEPYTGPFQTEELLPFIDRPMTEFWSHTNALTRAPEKLKWNTAKTIEAEAFTAAPENARWDETPWSLKVSGDAQFARGVSRLILHSNPLQPWPEHILPGISMGRWGTHFGRTQTWSNHAKAWFDYLARCQSLLQWGSEADNPPCSSQPWNTPLGIRTRTNSLYTVCFLSNGSDKPLQTTLKIPSNQAVDWFEPVGGTIRKARPAPDGWLTISLFPRQSGFVVYGPDSHADTNLSPLGAETRRPPIDVRGPWQITFQSPLHEPISRSGGLFDWTTSESPEIRYFSGTARYQTAFDCPEEPDAGEHWISLGNISGHTAAVTLNGTSCGIVWCAPWRVAIPNGALKKGGNKLVVEYANVWANRLIGDTLEPEDCQWIQAPYAGGFYLARFPDWFVNGTPRPSQGRRCFTTWNYFTSKSPLVPSGLIGPVRIE